MFEEKRTKKKGLRKKDYKKELRFRDPGTIPIPKSKIL
jgi:hypothetical protein